MHTRILRGGRKPPVTVPKRWLPDTVVHDARFIVFAPRARTRLGMQNDAQWGLAHEDSQYERA